MSLARFVFLSAVVAAVLFAAILGVVALTKLEVSRATIAAGSVCGFFVSTLGWGIVRVGMRDKPERIVAYFGAALLLKLMLLGLISGIVMIEGSMELGHFLIPFAAVFLMLGFAQLAATVKEATKCLDAVASKTAASREAPLEATGKVEG